MVIGALGPKATKDLEKNVKSFNPIGYPYSPLCYCTHLSQLCFDFFAFRGPKGFLKC